MDSLFGAPMGTLMVIFVIAFVIVVGVVAVLALRNPVLLKLGLRGIPRRRGRTILIVLGLMLGTLIISAAFGTGDTMTHTIRSTVITSLGNIDEVISVKGADTGRAIFVQAEAEIDYFDEALFAEVEAEIGGSELVDGLAPVIIEPVAVQDRTSQQNEPRVTLFAIDPARMDGFGEIKQVGGGIVSLADLAKGEVFEVYLNDEAADELSASAGDELVAFAAERIIELRVKAVVKYQGGGTDEAGMMMALDAAQSLLGKEGQINHIMVSNKGDALSGVKHTEAVIASLEPVLDPLGLEAAPTKEDALDFANELGSVFTSFFITFGTFSIAAGIMLILLIFVMLAAERKPEMGMARAVGTKRRHLVEMFLFEGMVYDLLAAGVGAVLGLAVAFGMVLLMAKAFATFGVEIQHDFRLRSLVVAYTMGMLLTFIVVTVSAWRVSVLNIVTAIRDLPEPVMLRGPEWKRGRRWAIAGILLTHLYVPMSILAFVLSRARLGGPAAWLRRQRPPATWFLGVAGVELGLMLTISGLSARQATLFGMGISFLIMALVPLLRRLGAPDRAAFTLPGILLVAWWLRPFDSLDFILPDMSSDVSIFIASGIMLVIGGTWTLMYNSDLLLGAIMAVFGRVRRLAPVLKTAISYPLTNRFRTGMTVAMFSLVVFTLVVMATLTNAFSQLLNDEEAFGGGFDIRAQTLRINPVDDMAAAIQGAEALDIDDFEVVANQSILTLAARQVGLVDEEFESYPVRGFDDEFLAHNTYEFAIIAEDYGSAREVWQALADNPGLAIVDPIPVPTRDNFGFQAGIPDFKLEGFFIEDETFRPVEVEVLDEATGETVTLTIIGVLKETFPPFMFGLGTSQKALTEAFGAQAELTVHFFGLAENADVDAVAHALEVTFLMNGMEADVLAEEMEKLVGTQLTFNYILQGFMGLGLVVGVAALGVISARSVVERRQQIGVLRAIGFQRGMVQISFLLESSFVALLGIGLGSVLGLVLAYNIIQNIANEGGLENIKFAVPWLNLTVIFLIAYGASLVTTYLPARQASRVYPAQALRYE